MVPDKDANERPLLLVAAAGFTVERSERLKAGIVARLTAVKP
jgi:hypothetical protein